MSENNIDIDNFKSDFLKAFSNYKNWTFRYSNKSLPQYRKVQIFSDVLSNGDDDDVLTNLYNIELSNNLIFGKYFENAPEYLKFSIVQDVVEKLISDEIYSAKAMSNFKSRYDISTLPNKYLLDDYNDYYLFGNRKNDLGNALVKWDGKLLQLSTNLNCEPIYLESVIGDLELINSNTVMYVDKDYHFILDSIILSDVFTRVHEVLDQKLSEFNKSSVNLILNVDTKDTSSDFNKPIQRIVITTSMTGLNTNLQPFYLIKDENKPK